MIIKNGVSNPDVYCNLDGLDYPKSQWTLIFNNVTINSDGTLNESTTNVGIRSKYDIEYVLVQPQPITSWMNEAGVRYSDLDTLLIDLNTYFDFSESTFSNSTSDIIIREDYSFLPPTGEENKIYITENDYYRSPSEISLNTQIKFYSANYRVETTDINQFNVGDIIKANVSGLVDVFLIVNTVPDPNNANSFKALNYGTWLDVDLNPISDYNTNGLSALDFFNVFLDSYKYIPEINSKANSMYMWDGTTYIEISNIENHIKQISTTDITNWNNKQDNLISGTNIKTVGGQSLLGSGNLNLSSGSSGWGLTGNSSIDQNTDFIGTTDSKPLIFKTNNTEAFRVNESRQVEIGGSQSPYNFAKLYVDGNSLQRNGAYYIITTAGQGVYAAQWGSTAQFAIRDKASAVELDSLQGHLILNPGVGGTRYIGMNTPSNSNPTATLDVNGSARFRNLANSQGDATFIKFLTQKADGTVGSEPYRAFPLTQLNNQDFATLGVTSYTNTIVYDTSSKSLAFSNGIEWIDVGRARPLLISSTVNIVADLYYDNFFVQNPITITIQGSYDAGHSRNRQRKYYFTNSSNGNVTIIHSPNSGFLPPQPSVIIGIGETRVFTRTDDGQYFFVSKA